MKKYFIDLESASILVKSDSFGKKNLQHWQKTNTFIHTVIHGFTKIISNSTK